MRRFEQAISKSRCSIMQFHCPVKLKLKRLFKMVLCTLVYSIPNARVFFISNKKDVVIVYNSHGHSRSKPEKMMVAIIYSHRYSPPVT